MSNIYDELLKDLDLNGYLPFSLAKKPLMMATIEHELNIRYQKYLKMFDEMDLIQKFHLLYEIFELQNQLESLK